MRLKQSRRQQGSTAKEWALSHLLKYLLQKQQIQQMNAADQEASIMIFYKLKHLLFEDDWEEEHIVSFLKEDPIKAIDSVILTLTQQYNRKVEEIVEPLKEDKNFMLNKLEQVRKQLQRSLQQNQELKAIIDRHEDINKEAELKIREQETQIYRIKEINLLQINEKNQIKNQCLEILEKNRQMTTENYRIKEYILNSDKEFLLIKSLQQNLRAKNQQLISQINLQESKIKQMQAQILGQNQRNHLLIQKIAEKQEFISSFVNQYNRIHIFGKRSEDSKSCKNQENQEEDKDELRGFNFNQFEKQSITSKKSESASNNKQNEQSMDNKFRPLDAAYQKLKCLMASRNIDSSHRKYEIGQHHLQLKNNKMHIKSVNNSILKSQKSHNYRSKRKITTVFTKNHVEKQPIHTPSSNHYEEKNCINSLLEKKLIAHNQQIDKLQKQIEVLNNQYIEQRQEMTEMEGGYELQIDELKNQLSFIKEQFNETYQHYLLAKLELQACQQKIQQMQLQIEQMKQQHRLYCEQLKDRCKKYVTTKIDQVEKEYQLMKQQIADFNFKKDQQHQNQNQQPPQIHKNTNHSSDQRLLQMQDNRKIAQQKQINSGHEIFEKIQISRNEQKNIQLLDINNLKDKVDSTLTINTQIDEIYMPFSKSTKLSIDSDVASISILPYVRKKSFFNTLSEKSSVDMLNKQNTKINSEETNFGTLQSKIKTQRPNQAVISYFSLANQSISSLSETPPTLKQQSKIQSFTAANQGPNLPPCQLQQIYQTSEYILQRSNTYESLKQLNDESSVSIEERDKKYNNMKLFPTKILENIQQPAQKFPKSNIEIPYFRQDQILSNSSQNAKCQQEGHIFHLQNSISKSEEQNHSVACNSLVNKATIVNDSLVNKTAVNQKVSGKDNCDKRIQQRDADISHWFFEGKKQNEEKERKIFTNLDEVEQQVKMNLNEVEIMRLRDYLGRNSIKLRFQQLVTRKYFKKPMDVSRKLLIFITKLNQERQIFLLSKLRLYCLQNDKEIKFEESQYIDTNNFMFGQSEVIITGDAHLVIHRKGKKNKLDGNLEDGQWPIDGYIVCTFQNHNQH